MELAPLADTISYSASRYLHDFYFLIHFLSFELSLLLLAVIGMWT